MSNLESPDSYKVNLDKQFSVYPIGPDEIVLQKYTDFGQTGINVFCDGLRLTPKVPIASSKGEVIALMDRVVDLTVPICDACPFFKKTCEPGLYNSTEEGVVVLYVQNDMNAPFPSECNIYNPSNPTSP